MNVLKIIIRNKWINCIYLLLFTIIFILIFSLLMLKNYTTTLIITESKKYEENRGVNVYTDDISLIEDILCEYQSVYYYPVYASETINFNDYVLSVNYNRNLLENEIYISNNASLKLNYSDNNITFNFNNKDYSFIIKDKLNAHTDIFLSLNMFNELYNNLPSHFYVLLNSYYDAKSFINEVGDIEVFSELADTSHLKELEILELSERKINLMIYSSLPIIFLIIYYIIKAIITSDLKNISLYRILGFRTKMVLIYIFKRVFILIFSSFIILNFITYVLASFNIAFLKNINIVNYNLFSLIVISIILIINLINYYFKLKKVNYIKVLE